jgi:hypothetical protein
MNKKTPNPEGRKGKADHQNKIKEIYLMLLEKLGFVRTEARIELEENKSRYADVAGLDENDKPIEYHQAGRTNKNGTPVARERRAMDDIERATGIKVIFHPLKVLAIGLILGVLYLMFKYAVVRNLI